ncbi:hypothetical protein [Dactylosporangium sp. NPDC049140]|uniref:hypothetical protein n=1 Tax=Dactylosporangium sp. NPDC049140 TaxID=3155647 RepID=UPI0033DD71E3
MTPGRRWGWAALAVGVAAVVAIVPPLLLPSESPPGAAGLATASASPSASARPSPETPTAFAPILVHAADRANLRKGARVIDCPTCDGGSRVGYIGGPNTLAIRVPDVPAAGERTLVIVYETEVLRTLKVAVADGPVHTLTLAGAGDYLIPARTSLTVFLPAGSTWIRCFNDAGDAPDINRIELR